MLMYRVTKTEELRYVEPFKTTRYFFSLDAAISFIQGEIMSAVTKSASLYENEWEVPKLCRAALERLNQWQISYGDNFVRLTYKSPSIESYDNATYKVEAVRIKGR